MKKNTHIIKNSKIKDKKIKKSKIKTITWSTTASFTVSPTVKVPESAFSLPMIILIKVDLPAPLGPITPTIAPNK